MKEILNRMEELTNEKYDWLENKANKEGEKFDFEREKDVWYTMKIAELQLKLEQFKN